MIPATANPNKLVGGVFERVFRPRLRMTASQWAQRHRVVGSTAVPGPWDHARTPHLRQIMDAGSDPLVRRIAVMKAEQVGGTEAIYNILFPRILGRPIQALYVYPNQDMAVEVNKRRLLPTMLQHPELRALMTSLRDDTANLRLSFGPDSYLHFAGANSEANLESFARNFVVIDELDRCAGGVSAIVTGRTKTYADALLLEVSTPSDEGRGIAERYASTDRRRWWTPCPHCGEWHTKQTFSGIGWPQPESDDGRPLPFAADPDEVEARAWWTCHACGAAISAAEHRAASVRGIWCPTGWRPRADLEGAPGWDAVADRLGPDGWDDPRWPTCLADYDRELVPDEGHEQTLGQGADDEDFAPLPPHPSRPGPATGPSVGFHVHGWDACLVANPFGEIAREFVELKGQVNSDAGRQWVCRRVGDPFRAAGERVESHQLRVLAVKVARGGYRLKDAPAGCLPALVQTIDVQKRCLYVEVRAFGPMNQWTALVDAYRVGREEGLRLTEDAVTALPQATYTTGDGRELRIGWVGIDSAYWTEDVYDLIARWRRMGVLAWAMRGLGTFTMREVYAEKPIGEATDIRRFKGSIHPLIEFDSWKLKTSLMARIHHATRAAGGRGSSAEVNRAMLEQAADDQSGVGEFRLPEDCPTEYMVHLCAEQRVEAMSRGMVMHKWEVRPGYKDRNHHLDTCVMAHALARRVGLHEASAASLSPSPAAQRSQRVNESSRQRFGRGALERR